MDEKELYGSPVTVETFLDIPRAPVRSQKSSLFTFVKKKDCWLLALATIFTVLASLVPAAVTILLSKVFDKLQQFAKNDYSSASDFIKDVEWFCFGVIFVGLGSTLFSWLGLALFLVVGERQQKRCRTQVLECLLGKELEWFDKTSDLNSNLIQINRCIEEYRSGVSECLEMFIKSVTTIISLLVLSFYYSWRMTLLVLATIPVIVLVTGIWGFFIGVHTNHENSHCANAIKVTEWNLLSYFWVKLSGAQSLEKQNIATALKLASQSFMKIKLFMSINTGIIKFLALTMFIQSFWYGSFLVRHNLNSSGDVISCFYSCLNVSRVFSNVSTQLVGLKTAKESLRKVFDTIEWSRQSYYPGFEPKHDIKGEIRISGVSFRYPTRKEWGLADVTLAIPPSSMMFIVGRSGSGKSTLASLLLGLYEFRGKITIDDYDVSRLDTSWLATQITLVHQQCTLFDGTIRENLTLASKGPVSSRSLQRALQLSSLDQFIDTLPNGLETKLGSGEDAVSLSGGQKQRLAIARAVLRDTPILIMDESLSAIDYTQRMLILERIRKWRRDRQVIVLTHEYSEINDNDHVVVMDGGRVVEQDTKINLLKKESKFAQLQFQKVVPENPFEQQEEETEQETTFTALNDIESQETKKISPLQLFYQLWRTQKLSWILMYVSGNLLTVANSSMTPLFSFFLSKLIVGIVHIGGSVSDGYLRKWAVVLIAIALLDGFTLFASKYILNKCSETVVDQLKQKAFSKILRQPATWFQRVQPSQISSLLINDTRDLRTVISDLPSQILAIIALALVAMVWSLIVCWNLALVGFSFAPLFVIFSMLFSMLLQKYEDAYKQSTDKVEAVVHECVVGMKTVICLNLRDYFQIKFNCNMDLVTAAGKKRAIIISLAISIQNIVIYLSQGVMLYYGIKLVSKKSITLVQMMQVITLIMFSTGYISSLLSSSPSLNKGLAAFGKLSSLLQLPNNDQEFSGSVTPKLSSSKSVFRFQNVQFSYPNSNTNVLSNFNISFMPNQISCLVGKSGCGKSTVLSLLLRLYPVQGGVLRVAGTDISQINMDAFKSMVSVVTQEHYFFDGTIEENLKYNLEKPVTTEQIYSVLELVDLATFVRELPDKLDTRIGGSSNLLISGGQLQRLCIARALIRSPKILVLDECTSHLDPENTQNIAHVLQRLKSHVTIIIISHQKELMQVSDWIAYMEDGIVKEKGSYAQLMNKKSLFYQLIN
ncbi:hypothetical protein OGAPHI_004499 [Ogataea philodendri]|uniref:Alpha-factor-transporting ATPase n=1 Tax=Ogataea philodendri TaxID=1378263 RepID=A0A9P8P779_9ASCO|nr:uncharacterized protein OGAPHI_004499 [Ogataea philodendri]KAH3666310.1 hypothetical protein OGAPHI_004499 [Ogataea philodendri]